MLSSGCAEPELPTDLLVEPRLTLTLTLTLILTLTLALTLTPTRSSPAMHASFEGDLDALETLRLNGCDLRQKLGWGLGLGRGLGLP